MVRKFVTATVSAALCSMSIVPTAAFAQDYRSTVFDAPRGATATLNLRVPMGREHADRASYGLTLGYGQAVGAPDQFGQQRTRAMNFADFRFRGGDLRNARVVGVDFANLERDMERSRRMNLMGGPNGLIYTVGLVVVGGAVVCFVITDCFGDDDNDDDDNDNN